MVIGVATTTDVKPKGFVTADVSCITSVHDNHDQPPPAVQCASDWDT